MEAREGRPRWLSLVANLVILAGILLVVLELRQNTDHLRLQLRDQINSRLYENNRALMGDNPLASIEKSIVDPEAMTYSDFRIVDAYLINAVNEWEDRYFMYEAGLAEAAEWRHRVDEDVEWFFGNQYAKNWWHTNGAVLIEPELADYVTSAIANVSETATYDFFEATRVRSGR